MKKCPALTLYGEEGFTLIELLVVIAILGVIAAIAAPNVGQFIDTGLSQAAETERHNVQTAVLSAMAEEEVQSITGGDFGNTTQDEDDPTGTNLDVGTTSVGAFIIGGASSVQGDYDVAADGSVTQIWYPGSPQTEPPPEEPPPPAPPPEQRTRLGERENPFRRFLPGLGW